MTDTADLKTIWLAPNSKNDCRNYSRRKRT